jgi:FKBP-type peptidyl-prolyl cis-trans isomerase
LTNGTIVFDSRTGKPVTFLLGGNQVIAGVEEGVTACASANVACW